jgi:hypothetical protein
MVILFSTCKSERIHLDGTFVTFTTLHSLFNACQLSDIQVCFHRTSSFWSHFHVHHMLQHFKAIDKVGACKEINFWEGADASDFPSQVLPSSRLLSWLFYIVEYTCLQCKLLNAPEGHTQMMWLLCKPNGTG